MAACEELVEDEDEGVPDVAGEEPVDARNACGGGTTNEL